MTASTDTLELLVVANDEFARRLRLVGPDDWPRPTPCSEWDERALVNHVVGACVRDRMLLHGAQTNEVEATRGVDQKIASNFSNCSSCEWDVVTADVGGDFAYLLAIERTTASVGGSEPTPYVLRSTTTFRRENGEWKIVHRHADPIDDSADLLARLHRDR